LPRRAAPAESASADVAAAHGADRDAALEVSAGVTGDNGSTVATVSRRVRPAGPGESGPEVVVVVRGDVDLDTAPLAQATLIRALDDAERVCWDLSEVYFFGAAGARVVVAARQHAAARGRTLRLSGVHGIAERVLTLTGLYPPG
jgi:anti-anti-sigma factor